MIRYVRKNRRIYGFSLCKVCGAAGGCGPDGCGTAVCKACHTPQCNSNGLGHGACGICLVGILPGWSGSDRPCGYKGCGVDAVAFAPRVKRVCAAHMERSGVAAYVAARLAERDKEFDAVETSV